MAIGLAFSVLVGCERALEVAETEVAPEPGPHALSNYINQPVRVQFRRDALGAAANLPIGPRTSSMNGAETNLDGKLVATAGQDIIIEHNGRLKWIPREVILLVEVSP